MRKGIKRVLFALAACAVTGGVVLASAVVFLLVERRVRLDLPTPSGPFAVSRIAEYWTDAQRPDSFVGAPSGSSTELAGWIWYPCERSAGLKPAAYLPPQWSRATAPKGLLALVTRRDAVIHGHSVVDGDLPTLPARYPIVILRAGGGALTLQVTTLAEDLASHGYVVVGFDAPYRTFAFVLPDGTVVRRPPGLNPENLKAAEQRRLGDELVRAWASDIRFVLDRLTKMDANPRSRFFHRLDLTQIGVVGHSLGGATAAQVCDDDPRVRAGVDLDGRLFDPVRRVGVHKPFLFLLEDLEARPARDPEGRRIVAEIRSVYDRLPAESRVGFSVRGACHFSFTDSLLERSLLVRELMRAAGVLDLGPRRGLRITCDVVRSFLDVQLKAAPADVLGRLPTTYPELRPFPPSPKRSSKSP